MENKRIIRWLQISDLHIGKDNNKWKDGIIRKRILECIDDNMHPLDFVVITGDIFHKGQINDDTIEIAKKLISELKEISERILFCIGNHDYVRTQKRYDYLTLLNQEQDKRDRGNAFCAELKKDFDRFVLFCQEADAKSNPIETGTYVYKDIEGLNIVVLNTSVFSGNPKCDSNGKIIRNGVMDDGKLWFSELDLPDIEKIDLSNPTIVIGHHTIQMFEKDAQHQIIDMFKELHAVGYFCGHMHRTLHNKISGINQYTIAGTFSDNYNIPTLSVFMLEETHVFQKVYVYKDSRWSEKNTAVQKMKQLSSEMKKKVEKFKKILQFENLADTYNGLENETDKEINSVVSAANYQKKELFEKNNIKDILNTCVSFLRDDRLYDNIMKDTDISWEWVSLFFDHIKYVDDKDLQFLWGKLLADEIINTGSISKRTMSLVANLSKEEACIFNDMMKYVLNSPDESRSRSDSDFFIILSLVDNKYFTYYDILLLADAGLLMESDVLITVRVSPHAKGYVYQNNRVFFEFENESDDEVIYEATAWVLTKSGRELYKTIMKGKFEYDDDKFYNICRNSFISEKYSEFVERNGESI